MPNVLLVMALKLSHPVTHLVWPEPGDLALHPARQSEVSAEQRAAPTLMTSHRQRALPGVLPPGLVTSSQHMRSSRDELPDWSPMTKMNVNRARGGDDDFGAVAAEPTMPAKYAGTCGTCRQRFAVGDPIASVLVEKKMTYHHQACRYPATALLAQFTTEADVDAVATARKASTPGKCRATTNKGKPCNNAPQKGEQFCGPHLTQLVAGSSPDRQPTTRARPLRRTVLTPAHAYGGHLAAGQGRS